LIIKYIKVGFKYLKNRNPVGEDKKDTLIVRNILIATIPAGVIGLVVDKFLTNIYDNQITDKNVAFILVAIPMIIMGLLFIFEKSFIRNNKKTVEELDVKRSTYIGLSQALAFIRGTSRSGVTLLFGQLNGLSRYSAAEFSFFISIPIITASTIYEVFQFLKDSSDFSKDLITSYLLGAIAAFVVGLFAINFLMNFLKTRSLAFFGYYRVYFGVFLIFLVIFK